MIAWSIAQIALMGALLALAAFGAEAALRAARHPTRWAWVGALVMTVALAALVPLRSTDGTPSQAQFTAPTIDAVTPAVAAPTGVLVTLAAMWGRATASAGDAARDALALWHTAVPAGTDRTLLIAWGIASITLLVVFAAVHARFARRRAQWPVGTLHDTTVRIADDTGPAVIGVARAEIVVPRWLLSRDAREQQLVLAHEREHVRLRDPLLLAMAQAAIVLLPWHPAVWWMAARLRLAVELDCDRRVLQRGANARDYGTLLIDLTDHRRAFGAALPAFSCTPSHLERRLIAMTPTKLRYPLVRVVSAGAFASLALLAACEAKLPTSAEMDGMTAKTAVNTVLGTGASTATGIAYYVDSVRVSKDEAEKLKPEMIAAVNVEQGATPGAGAVYITTLAQAKTPAGSVKALPTGEARVSLRREPDTLKSPDIGLTIRGNGEAMTGTVKLAPDVQRRTAFTGLLMVDGVAREPREVDNLKPDQIASIAIIKGVAATTKYSDPRAANGVIEVITKAAAKP